MAQRKTCSDNPSNYDGVNYSLGPNIAQGGNAKTLASLQCPTNPYANGKVFTVTNAAVSVIDGANTLLTENLKGTGITVSKYGKQTVVLPGLTCTIAPNIPTKINFTGIEDTLNNGIKALGIFPSFSSSISDDETYIEWAYANEVEVSNSLLQHQSTLSTQGLTSFDTATHTAIKFDSTGKMYIGTLGGLMIFDGINMTLLNTVNSSLISDYITSIDIDSLDRIWIGTQGGALMYTPGVVTEFTHILTESTIISSVNVRDILVVNDDLIAIATDEGLTLYEPSSKTSKFIQTYTISSLLTNNITCLKNINSTTIAFGSNLGLYLYNFVNNTFTLYDNTTSGWLAANAVQCIDYNSVSNTIYVGTYIGIVTIPLTGTVFTTTASAAPNGPISSNATALFLSPGDGNSISDLLYVGHVQGISILDIDLNTWTHYTSTFYNNLTSRTNTFNIIPDTLPNRKVYVGTTTELLKFTGVISSAVLSGVPEVNLDTEIVFAYPSEGIQIPVSETIYILYSKPVTQSIVNNTVSVKDSNNTIITGTWVVTNYRLAIFTPDDLYTVGNTYSLNFVRGSRATDNSLIQYPQTYNFYTEDLVPFFGWRSFGKLNVLSGSKNKKVEPIYIRNPHFSDVSVDIILGN